MAVNPENLTLIVGAGASGILLARRLLERGVPALVLEKSRGVGGRVATRRIGTKKFDHGISSLTQRQKESLQLFPSPKRSSNSEKDSAALFLPLPAPEKGYVSPLGLTAPMKALSHSLTIRLGFKVDQLSISRGGKYWVLADEQGNAVEGARLVLTAPAPQSYQLLEKSFPSQLTHLKEKLSKVIYQKQIVLLGIGDSKIAESIRKSKEIDRVIDNGVKGIHDSDQSLSVYASPSFSEKYLDEPDEAILQKIEQSLNKIGPVDLSQFQVKRWRYSVPVNFINEPYLPGNLNPELFCIGDYFTPGNLDGAIHSANELANYFQHQITQKKDFSKKTGSLKHFGYFRR